MLCIVMTGKSIKKYCRAIFIHVDSRSKGKQTDVFFYHSNRRAESKKLANRMKDTFESKYGKHQPNRGFTGTVSGRNLYVLTRATCICVCGTGKYSKFTRSKKTGDTF